MRAYSPVKLTDNFFLGGSTTLRGFGMWGTGPRQNGKKSLSLSLFNSLKHTLVCMRVSYKESANMCSYYMAHKEAS